MNRTCESCDHDCVCGLDRAYGDGCEHWSGWIPVEEALPEGNDHRLVLVEYKLLKDENYYYDLVKAGLVKPSKYIAAWKYIQKYESRKEEEDERDNEDH